MSEAMLKGFGVLVTRPEHQADELSAAIEDSGGEAIRFPVIEIEPYDSTPFSQSGDSGSLIVDARRRAIGLLFAGNDVDATYANPIGTVLNSLGVDLVF